MHEVIWPYCLSNMVRSETVWRSPASRLAYSLYIAYAISSKKYIVDISLRPASKLAYGLYIAYTISSAGDIVNVFEALQ